MNAVSNKQRGATLVTTLVLVALLSLLAIYGVGISVMDQRSSANEFRAKEAGAAADNYVEQAVAYLHANRTGVTGWSWTPCTDTSPQCSTVDADDRTNWKYSQPNISPVQPYTNAFGSLVFLTPNSGPNANLLYNIVATGRSEDQSATNVTMQGAYYYPIIVGEIDAPMVAAGNISFNGNYSVVVNPNAMGEGSGVPLSAWSGSNITIGTGSPATCYESDYLKTNSTHTTVTDGKGHTLIMCPLCVCTPSSDLDGLSKAGVEGRDILDDDGDVGYNRDTDNFPDDVFEFMFGVPTSNYQQIKQIATIISDCSALNSTSGGFYWVTGNCAIGSDVGSFANPVLLIVQGNLSMNGSHQVFGLLFAFSTNTAATLDVTLNGGPTLYGAIMTNAQINLPVGTFKMRYNKDVLDNLKASLTARALSKIPGSWADY